VTTTQVSQASLFIGGAWLTSDRTIPVTAPADGSLVGEIHYADADLVRSACDAAANAFPDWSGRTARVRADILIRAGQLMSDRAEEIGLLLARETGKRLPEAVGEVRFAAEYFRWFGEEARRPEGMNFPAEVMTRRHMTHRKAMGVAAILTPWNFPISIPARKLAPALAAGCTVVARVSEKAPLAAILLIKCLEDAGVPAGALNLVHGRAAEVTAGVLSHPAVRVVSFTGSTGVGQQIMRMSADRVIRPLLELGGDAPFIVFPDADMNAAVEGAMLAKFRNAGQSCIGANRFYVHDSIFDEFTSAFASRVDAMTIGDGLATPTPDLGPLIDDARVKAVNGFVEDALNRGGTLITKERTLPSVGHYAAPALVVDAPEDCAMGCDEVFGPAAGIFRFSTEDEVIAKANSTEMGLAAYVWTTSLDRAIRIPEALQAGIIGVNDALPSVVFAPMGGHKQSGLGREGAAIGLEEFTETTYVALGGLTA
jgi:succinate-semialdehyde dehydrogenase / glutarate-semialdehyde dehydrogenase